MRMKFSIRTGQGWELPYTVLLCEMYLVVEKIYAGIMIDFNPLS